MKLTDLDYGRMTKGQKAYMTAHPTDILNTTFEAIPRKDFPANTSSEVLREFTLLSRASSYKLLPELKMVHSDRNLLDVFYAELQKVDLDFPDWVREYVQAMGVFILKLKQEYQRPRPYQLAQALGLEFEPEETKSGHSPSYPSGHAVQATALALAFENHFGDVLPWMEIAREISYSRIQLGVHYPSDIQYGEEIGAYLFEHSNFNDQDLEV